MKNYIRNIKIVILYLISTVALFLLADNKESPEQQYLEYYRKKAN
jgi:hypothetical protein